ncbi:MAG TPA: sigma-70 family RNA polymerase sigma factor [Solirubrobacteraceae bacterium]|nr:sigma-70 family RNA polymerase sigma factor [Solirubrobacteraceae bacterium]
MPEPASSAGGLTIAEVGELYRCVSPNLLRIVRCSVRAPAPVIEDACQLAWSRLLRNRDRVTRDKALSWLVTTALHEASRLVRRAGREISLETVIADDPGFGSSPDEIGPLAIAEARERLRSLNGLPQRQQLLLWLRGVGLSYDEIACRQGCTSRTVERQLRSARTSLRAA